MEALEIIVSGRVQGVGYRNYVSQVAGENQIKGTVRNLSNGDVKVIAQGDQANLESFISQIQVAQHRAMKIVNVETETISVKKEYSDFSPVY